METKIKKEFSNLWNIFVPLFCGIMSIFWIMSDRQQQAYWFFAIMTWSPLALLYSKNKDTQVLRDNPMFLFLLLFFQALIFGLGAIFTIYIKKIF